MIGVIAMKADKDEDELPQEELKPIAEWHPVSLLSDLGNTLLRISNLLLFALVKLEKT